MDSVRYAAVSTLFNISSIFMTASDCAKKLGTLCWNLDDAQKIEDAGTNAFNGGNFTMGNAYFLPFNLDFHGNVSTTMRFSV